MAPVLIGTSLAIRDDVFRWDGFVVTLAAALLIQVGVNYANDYSDGVRGTDSADRIGPPRAVASGLVTPGQMKRAIFAVFGLAAVLGLYLAAIAGPVIIVIGVASIVAAVGYTGGPVPYGYRGLGELFVFVFFGLVATVGTRYVFDRTAPLDAWVGGVVMGLLATAILVANNIRDIETDAAAGKRTLAVKLGRRRTQALFVATVAGAFVVTIVAVLSRAIPPGTALVLGAVPAAVPIVRTIGARVEGPPLIRALKGTARLQLIVGVLFAVGVLL